MIPREIIDYLNRSGIPFQTRPHPRAVSAQELAASVHVSGYRVAKSVIVRADGRTFIAVLPAAEMLDTRRFAETVGASGAELVGEDDFGALFGGCEMGAEPPFGGLYGLPVVFDSSLQDEEAIVLRAGSHEEAVEMKTADFLRLEVPLVGEIGSLPLGRMAAPQPELRV